LNINELYALISEKYNGGIGVVILIGIAKLFDNLLGNNNAILFSSNHYKTVLLMGVGLIGLTVFLNMLFIPKYGVMGSAYATFLAIVIYNIAKIIFVKYLFKITPFTQNTFKTLLLICVFSISFYFWDFSFHPFLNIFLKSALVVILYGSIIYRYNFSEDITEIINKTLKRVGVK
jgi:O-antigen/teichoic acid export membrane protein